MEIVSRSATAHGWSHHANGPVRGEIAFENVSSNTAMETRCSQEHHLQHPAEIGGAAGSTGSGKTPGQPAARFMNTPMAHSAGWQDLKITRASTCASRSAS